MDRAEMLSERRPRSFSYCTVILNRSEGSAVVLLALKPANTFRIGDHPGLSGSRMDRAEMLSEQRPRFFSYCTVILNRSEGSAVVLLALKPANTFRIGDHPGLSGSRNPRMNQTCSRQFMRSPIAKRALAPEGIHDPRLTLLRPSFGAPPPRPSLFAYRIIPDFLLPNPTRERRPPHRSHSTRC
jgi:hypothetical protein